MPCPLCMMSFDVIGGHGMPCPYSVRLIVNVGSTLNFGDANNQKKQSFSQLATLFSI